MAKYVSRKNEAHTASPMNILEPVLEQLGKAMSPPNLTAHAGTSQGSFAIIQCTITKALLLILQIAIIVGFIQLEELRDSLLNFLTNSKDKPKLNEQVATNNGPVICEMGQTHKGNRVTLVLDNMVSAVVKYIECIIFGINSLSIACQLHRLNDAC